MILKQAQEIFSKFNDIKYGFLDKSGKMHRETDADFGQNFMKDYILQTPEQVLENKIGVCWDQIELARKLFDKNQIITKTYLIVYFKGKIPAHTFLTFQDANKSYRFETSSRTNNGIFSYDSENEILQKYVKIFLEDKFNEIPENYDKEKFHLYEYPKPEYGIGVDEFFENAKNSRILF